MKKSICFAAAIFGILFTSAAFATAPTPTTVTCPAATSLTCSVSGNNHFYSATGGTPAGNWVSNFYASPNCPPVQKLNFVIASTGDAGAQVLCTYPMTADGVQIFQPSSPSYCVQPFVCPPSATRTVAGYCVAFGQSSCLTP